MIYASYPGLTIITGYFLLYMIWSKKRLQINMEKGISVNIHRACLNQRRIAVCGCRY